MRSKENEYIFNIIIMQVALSTGGGFRVIEKLIAMPVVRSRGRRSLWAEGQQGHQARGWQEEGRRRRRAPATSPDRRTPPWENVDTLIDISPHTIAYPTAFNYFSLFWLFWFFDPPGLAPWLQVHPTHLVNLVRFFCPTVRCSRLGRASSWWGGSWTWSRWISFDYWQCW